ncbi:MAG: hypothetical protein KF774_08350 [Planctomyces sp.]|nr:hypothetical protein [Planctomyces sp.]
MSTISARFGLMAACLGASLAPASLVPAWGAPDAKTPQGMVRDLKQGVEVVAAGRLRLTEGDRATVSVSLWNASDNDVAGPVLLVIDGAGIDGVDIANHPEQTADGRAVFEIVPAGSVLLSRGMTSPLELEFAVPEALSREQADAFQLAARVFGREVPASRKPVDDERDFAVRGKSYNLDDLSRVIAIQERNMAALMQKPGVVGTSVGENDRGELIVRVFTETRGQARALPGHIEGVEVQVSPTPGGFKVGPARDTIVFQDGVAKNEATRASERLSATRTDTTAAPGGDPTIRFDRPVPIGCSAFNATDVCASGTLGARCIDSSGKIYGLSNSHVMSKEGLSLLGEEIVQPSQGDNGCNVDLPDNLIGHLVDFMPSNAVPATGTSLQFSNFMDTALLSVTDSLDPDGNVVPAVDAATPEDGYGTPSSRELRNLRIGMLVHKYGRTTIYTRGACAGLNVNGVIGGGVAVEYYNMHEFRGTAPFANLGAPGDSGSLIVTVDGNRPVSLLFAGGGNRTLGNPIGPVLDRFNVKIDDGSRTITTAAGGNIGMSGRQGVAMGNLGPTVEERGLLPPELRGRIKAPSGGFIPKGPQQTP